MSSSVAHSHSSPDMFSNLSKIKPQLRTTGHITGNFGKPKAKAGSSLNEIGNGEVGSLPTLNEQLTLFLSIYPRMNVRWRRNMLSTLRSWGATLNRSDEVAHTVKSYAS